MRPYADSVAAYALAGWPCILPVPVADKHPPPTGFTGAAGRDTTPANLVTWAGERGDWSVALRLPDGVIGLDVDHYDKGTVVKRGGDTLAEHEARWGALPPTWISTARQLPSGIRFYRVPAGRYATRLGDAIEVIQRHHRYAVVAPSWHADAQAVYRWLGPDGAPADGVPKPDELPELPAAWVAGLAEGASEAGPAAAGESAGHDLLAALEADQRPVCAEVVDAGRRARELLRASETGTRHDTATERVYQLVQLGAAGHPGVAVELDALRMVWAELTAGEGREAEWERGVLTAARKAVTKWGVRPGVDPCLTAGGELWSAPAPLVKLDARVDSPPSIKLEQPWSVREVIGAHPFDPGVELDQTLAGEVLRRTWPVLRYAVDAGAWVLRGPDRWEVRGDLTRWAVHELAELMPRGNPEAEKGSDDRRRAERRKKLMSTAGRNAVGQSMAAAVAAGTHPCSLALGDLDTDPALIWAGGVPWDLRRCADRPEAAQLDPGTPHLHSAACAPAEVPTPAWDAFLAAVWPDPELRAWALRVLAIAFTGEPDAALPILLGPQRRGKSQVVHLLMSVLGSYALAADPRLLANSQQEAPGHAKRDLLGKRLAFIDEGPPDGRWGQERLKQLTGGTTLTGDAKYQAAVNFHPTHTLVLTANREPNLTDPAVRARVRLIPCEGEEGVVRQARTAIGDTSGATWRAEAPGVLAAMMREAARWLADRDSGLTAAAPEGIRDRVEILAAEQRLELQWLAEECEPWEPATRSGLLYQDFVAWCRRSNVQAGAIPSATRWGREITELGYPPEHTREGKVRRLRVRLGGAGVMPGPASPAGYGVTGLVTGRDGFPDQPVTGGNPSSEGENGGSVTGVTGSLSTNLDSFKSSKINRGNENIERFRETPQPVTRTPPGLTPDQVIQGLVTGSRTNPSRAETPPQDPQPDAPAGVGADRPSRKINPKTGRLTKAAAREAEREAARAAAGGAALSLPAVVERSGRITPLTVPEAAASVAELTERAGGALTVDVETTGYPVGHRDYALRTVQLGDALAAVVLDPGDPEQAAAARAALAAAARLHAHSATADLVPLVDAGLLDEGAWERMHDTVIPAKLADPQSTGSDPGLKQLAETVLRDEATAPAADKARAALFKAYGWLTDTKLTTPLERSGWAQVDPRSETMIRYAASDVLDTAALAVRLPALPAELVERERAVQRITARVAHRGLRVDRDQVSRLEAQHRPALEAAAAAVRELGVENPGSDRQLADRLTELRVVLPRTEPSNRFPEGQPSVAAGVLEALRGAPEPAGALIAVVLTYRHHETALSTFLEPYRVLCDHGDGRARPTVYTLGADTGRMSCVRPNLQQVPREGGFRACLTADPGQLLISADFSGVEIRVMAALSQDPDLIRILKEGADLHAIVAEQAFGREWTKADRYTAKRGVFGWAYGGGVPSLARQVGVPEHVMAAIVDSLRLVAPTYVQWADQLKQAVRAGRTQLPTYGGRIIHLQQQYPHKAPNYAVQGTARELLVDALLKWEWTPYGGGVVLPVHDEIVAVVAEQDAEAATAVLVECMTTELYGVPIVAEPSAPSLAWSDSA